MKRHHDMPFGAQIHQDGTVRFRLWAPAVKTLTLALIGENSRDLPMNPRQDGWFELATRAAKSGSQYYFRVDGEQRVPDPASRFQPGDVHGPSEVINPDDFNWEDDTWHGRPWHEAIIYEIHVGAFTPAGTFAGIIDRLDYLADLGITAIELMPVADFPGQRNWGYDGVLPFAPDSLYGRPEDLKKLVQQAHKRHLMVLLDVVYNHFGPEGNYLRAYAPQFFTDRHRTPWGDAINFDGPGSRMVRHFFIHNALYWLTEYHLDGLRFDAVHAIVDDFSPHILRELAAAVTSHIGRTRHVHLILENDANQATYLCRSAQCQRVAYSAQWNDDIHHSAHVLLTGETDGYYVDYAQKPLEDFARCLTSGFAYQGEPSIFRNGEPRGEKTDGLPPTSFVSFLQNHDQVGNRAFGERIVSIADPQTIRAMLAILLLAPSVPLLFMGEEFGADTPFLFFCDFEKSLATAVTSGRRNEFTRFAKFADPAVRDRIPDPNAETTFAASHLDWKSLENAGGGSWLLYYRELLRLRRERITPMLLHPCEISSEYEILEDRGMQVQWQFRGRSRLQLVANLSDAPLIHSHFRHSQALFTTTKMASNTLPAWSVAWFLLT